MDRMKDQLLEFKPLIRSSYYQTVLGTLIDFEPELSSKTHYVKLQDGDVVTVEVSTPVGWKEDHFSVLMIHGLCGSHKSHYMKRIARRLYKRGIQAIRINFRGCGSGRGLAKQIYHSGSSEDILEVIEYVRKTFPKSPRILLGISLGANVSLKLGGELGNKAKEYLEEIIAISPPADLFSSARLFTLPENAIYAKYFLKLLLREVHFRHRHFDLPPHNLPSNITLEEFDELYIAREAKFSSAFDYYYYSSSKRWIPKINIPTKILFAKDDPIIYANMLDDLELPSYVRVYKTEHGGHIGFVGFNIFRDFRWMDNKVVSWVLEAVERN